MSHCNVMSETLKNTSYNKTMSNESNKMTPNSCIHDDFISKLLFLSSVLIQAVISFMQMCPSNTFLQHLPTLVGRYVTFEN